MRQFPVADGHCDTAYELLRRNEPLRRNSGHISLEQAEKLPRYWQFFAFWTELPPAGVSEAAWFRQMYQNLTAQLEQNRDCVRLCTTGAEVRQAWERGKLVASFSMEGTGAIASEPARLEELYQLGIRMISLTWNAANPLAGSYITGEVLSVRGREFVRRAQRLGMLIDVSHLSERAFWDLCDVTEGPIMASHSNARAVCGHGRNLSDAQFREICSSGGTAGINLYRAFLVDGGKARFDDVQCHLEHFLDLGGEDHLALGGDLDGCHDLPLGFADVADYNRLAEFLQNAGFSESLLEKIYYKNLMRVVMACNM